MPRRRKAGTAGARKQTTQTRCACVDKIQRHANPRKSWRSVASAALLLPAPCAQRLRYGAFAFDISMLFAFQPAGFLRSPSPLMPLFFAISPFDIFFMITVFISFHFHATLMRNSQNRCRAISSFRDD
jgi:hypothetical protein